MWAVRVRQVEALKEERAALQEQLRESHARCVSLGWLVTGSRWMTLGGGAGGEMDRPRSELF